MRYMLLLYSPTDLGDMSQEDIEAEMPLWFDYQEKIEQAGIHVVSEALQSVQTATTVRVRDGETLVTDGPFAETKEFLGGFYVIDAPDLETAKEWAAKVPNVSYGTVEVRPIMEIPAEAR